MEETAKAIIRYPFYTEGKAFNSVVTVLDRIAVKQGKEAVYGLPGGTIEQGETPEDALIREISEELGLRIKKASKIGKIGRHHIFLVDSVKGVINQNNLQMKEVLGLGFLNSGRERRIPPKMLQRQTKYVIEELLGE